MQECEGVCEECTSACIYLFDGEHDLATCTYVLRGLWQHYMWVLKGGTASDSLRGQLH